MRFWLDKGIDGFRIDTVNMYSKGTEMPDAPIVNPESFEQPAADLFCNGPRMHEFLREMNEKVLRYYDAMTVGELPNTPDPARVLRYVCAGDRQLSMVFQFDIVDLGVGKVDKYDFEGFHLQDLKNVTKKWQQFITGTDGWTTVFCENHDQGRSVSRYASDAPENRVQSAKLLAIMLATLTGTLFIYQGQEIGMTNAPKDWPIEEYKDIEALGYYHTISKRTHGDPVALEKVMRGIQQVGRDNARLPMQWDASPNAGFTSPQAKPWLRVNDNCTEINVASQQKDADSVLNFWKQMLKLRKQHRDVFIHGGFEVLDEEDKKLFVYEKRWKNQKAVVVLNFTGAEQPWKKDGLGNLELLASNVKSVGEVLTPYEARVYTVT
jgi:oligo-1,6-glucosidase